MSQTHRCCNERSRRALSTVLSSPLRVELLARATGTLLYRDSLHATLKYSYTYKGTRERERDSLRLVVGIFARGRSSTSIYTHIPKHATGIFRVILYTNSNFLWPLCLHLYRNLRSQFFVSFVEFLIFFLLTFFFYFDF